MRNVMVIVGSPANKTGNSESIADYLIDKLNNKQQACSKLFLRNEIGRREELIERIINTDLIIFSFPIYANSVPGLVLDFFEFLYQNKDRLSDRPRKTMAISNSGFAEPEANHCAINCCRLFAKEIGFSWMGGFGVAPGTLIDGKKLEEAAGTYKKLINLLNIISEKIYNDQDIPESAFRMVSKPLIPPIIYRVVGKMIQNGVSKKIGKKKYYAKPLVN